MLIWCSVPWIRLSGAPGREMHEGTSEVKCQIDLGLQGARDCIHQYLGAVLFAVSDGIPLKTDQVQLQMEEVGLDHPCHQAD